MLLSRHTAQTAPSSSGRSGKAPPALEHALSRGLWPESLTEEEVLRHWVVIHANEAAAAAAALEGEEENEAVGQSQQRGESQLARLLQQKSALRNSVRQLLSLRRGWKQEKASGGDAAAAAGGSGASETCARAWPGFGSATSTPTTRCGGAPCSGTSGSSTSSSR